jgi:uncharacterized protein (DUF1501 family)
MKVRTRREFLRLSSGLAGLGALGGIGQLGSVNAWAQGGDYKALVCVFLFGGNDSNNMVIPVSEQYDQYQQVRGPVAIPRADLLPMFAAGEELGLHPAMGAMHPLWSQGKMAVVANVGTLVRPLTRATYRAGQEPRPGNLFSHSDQQRQWQTAPPNDLPGTGWGGRIADRIRVLNAPSTFPTGVSVAGSSSLLVGQVEQPGSIGQGTALGLQGGRDQVATEARNEAVQEMLDFDSGFVMMQAANGIFSEGLRIGRLLEATVDDDSGIQTPFPGTGLGQQLLQIARIIRVRAELGMRRQIFFCSDGGYDTHSNQLGRHVGLLSEVGDAIAAFHMATQELGVENEVTTFTESDFNRTFEPNSNLGTDHAWGSNQCVVGGAVQGGALYGRFPELVLSGPDDADSRGRWIPQVSLDQYGATLGSWFGLGSSDVNAVFPNLANFSQKNLGFLG